MITVTVNRVIGLITFESNQVEFYTGYLKDTLYYYNNNYNVPYQRDYDGVDFYPAVELGANNEKVSFIPIEP